ncbi:apiosidase-like domain-containing protein [Chryseolinea lacunae]|uniref:DUF4038 domain-containing protein n=1 Tax=Chryseolinea lacunae TaxID=2801331 RepID=A0ABS1KY67_9BACT|nr:DUF4038 domain-containing protein [Chryseolinea lacunae]MBL0744339.1 DUF4038 domain-containing protein [Chryseolinea lacunae]
MKYILPLFLCLALAACRREEPLKEVPQWTTLEILLTAEKSYPNPYTDVSVWAVFKNDADSLVRPAFWDGANRWKVRFAPLDSGSTWTWKSYASVADNGLANKTGALKSVSYSGSNTLLKHGFLKMSPGKRNAVHADGTPFFVVGDTPWGIPFRATAEQVKVYSADRQKKGFNAALLMSVQPDRYAEGPARRDTVTGFARGFDDLPEGHINKLKPEYFQHLDNLMDVLVDHGIVPVYQPVFHGFGWKGKTVLGTTADPTEYARYCQYLVARYGSMPAFWLVSADGTGLDPGVKPGGEMVEMWDAYKQPTGIHYNPADNYLAPWAQGDSTKCFHHNRSHQAEPWLDFQWAQSGHEGKHVTYKVSEMYATQPTKANLNGEPTYEGMGGGKLGLGWWQGEEAWSNLMEGGTMGVVYGAAGLWQWKITPDEPGWGAWTDQPVSWREAIDLEGSRYVGYVAKAFAGFDFADMEKRWELTEGNKPLLAKAGKFYVAYLPAGGELKVKDVPVNMPYYWFNPKTGEEQGGGKSEASITYRAPDAGPWVLLIGERSN